MRIIRNEWRECLRPIHDNPAQRLIHLPQPHNITLRNEGSPFQQPYHIGVCKWKQIIFVDESTFIWRCMRIPRNERRDSLGAIRDNPGQRLAGLAAGVRNVHVRARERVHRHQEDRERAARDRFDRDRLQARAPIARVGGGMVELVVWAAGRGSGRWSIVNR